ncbi:hypothetical protein LTR66_007186 [Elasticomyces elasticus]|nr:hypothetical protein LTR66_007186 [Elasticomyces elasticus]
MEQTDGVFNYEEWCRARAAASAPPAADEVGESNENTYVYVPMTDNIQPAGMPQGLVYPAAVKHPSHHPGLTVKPRYHRYQQYAYPLQQQVYPYYYQYGYAAPPSPPKAPPPTYTSPIGYYAYPPAVAYAGPGKTADGKNIWLGRTKAQVDEDNMKIAMHEVNKPTEWRPKPNSDDQMFWVVEVDGTHTLRTFQTIEGDLQPGKWVSDQRFGSFYFVREEKKEMEEEKKKTKEKKCEYLADSDDD